VPGFNQNYINAALLKSWNLPELLYLDKLNNNNPGKIIDQ